MSRGPGARRMNVPKIQLASGKAQASGVAVAGRLWTAMVPLWDVDRSGWFVYGPDHRLVYANPAMEKLTDVPIEVGSTEFVFDVPPHLQRAVQRVLSEMRRGVRASCSMVVAAVIDSDPVPVRLAMSVLGDWIEDQVVIGNASRVFAAGAYDSEERDARTFEIALERIVAEATAVLPESLVARTASLEFDELSDRQNEIVALILAGLDTKDVADHLYLSRHTVRNHIQSILGCLGVHSQAELIALCRARQVHPSAWQRR